MSLQINRVTECLQWLQTIDLTKWQSIAYLNEFLAELSASIAFVNEQMALSKRLLNERKQTAYNAFLTSDAKTLPPMLAKDYIASLCSLEQYNYDLCERCSRALVHTLDAARTAQSALKQELSTLNFQK